MAQLTPEFIDEVRRRTDIVAVISDYVALRRRGRNLVGQCPFHNDRTPSFSVSPEKQLFYCFGCQAGGDVFDFVALKDGVPFPEAVLSLASRLGLKPPAASGSGGPQEGGHGQVKERLRSALEAAARFYRAVLQRTANPAKVYLEKRGVAASTEELFGLGYAPPGWDNLVTALTRQGYAAETLIQAGLAMAAPDGRVYDRFRNRLMFPIRDEQGRVIGFGGRVLDDGESPKYLNSPETILFNKRRVWFGLDLARGGIRREGWALVVEGYMDVLTSHQHGFGNAVASLGTALSPEQVLILRRYTEEVVIAYDADTAGEMATMRGLGLFREGGCRVRVARVPEGKDPDEFLRVRGEEGFRRVLREALPLVDYVLETALNRHGSSTPEGKAAVAQEVIPHLRAEGDAVARAAYIERISRRLGVPEDALREELKKHERQVPKLAKRAAQSGYVGETGTGHNKRNDCHNSRSPGGIMSLSPGRPKTAVERRLVGLLLRWPGLIGKVRGEITGEDFDDLNCRRIVKTLLSLEGVADPAQHMLLEEQDAEIRGMVAALMLDDTDFPEPGRAAEDCVRRIKRRRWERRLAEISKEIDGLVAKGLPIPASLGGEWRDLQRKVRGLDR